jgi:hypothetical protein
MEMIHGTEPQKKRRKKSAFEKLPKTVRAVIAKARSGQAVCKSLRQKDTGETEVTYFYEPSGKRAGQWAVKRAIDSGFLVPSNDGLFAGMDQTWTAQP